MTTIDYSQLTDHPDHDEIISKIVTGVIPEDISKWLKVKYNDKDQKHLQLPVSLIKEFAEKQANLESQLKHDIVAIKTGQTKKISESLLNNKTYMARITELAGEKLDVKKMISDLVFTARARLEQMFDMIQENPRGMKADYALIKWFELIFNALEKYDKIEKIEAGVPDQIIQVNIQNQLADQYSSIFQEAIRETLLHIDSESALLFTEILTKKLSMLKPPKQEVIDIEKETKSLKDTISLQLQQKNE